MVTDAAHDLRSLIEAEAHRPSPAGYEGEDWFQLSEAEEEVFGINPDRMPLLVAAWGAYEAFKAAAEGTDWDMRHQLVIDAARAARPELAAEPYGEEGWMRFAAAFSTLTLRDAWRWWSKNEAWQDRAGVMTFKDGS